MMIPNFYGLLSSENSLITVVEFGRWNERDVDGWRLLNLLPTFILLLLTTLLQICSCLN